MPHRARWYSPVPDGNPGWLFLYGRTPISERNVTLARDTYSSGVVHRSEQHERRIGDSLEGAADHTQRSQCCKVLRDRLQPTTKVSKSQARNRIGDKGRWYVHENGTPHEDIERQVVGGRGTLHDQVGGDCPDQPTEVENTVLGRRSGKVSCRAEELKRRTLITRSTRWVSSRGLS